MKEKVTRTCFVWFFVGLCFIVGSIVLASIALSYKRTEDIISSASLCASPPYLIPAIETMIVYSCALLVTGAALIVDSLKPSFITSLDIRPGFAALESDNRTLILRRKTYWGGLLTVVITIVYIIMFGINLVNYSERTDNYVLQEPATAPPMAIMLQQGFSFRGLSMSDSEACSYLEKKNLVPSLSLQECMCEKSPPQNCNPQMKYMGCSKTTLIFETYYTLSWEVILVAKTSAFSDNGICSQPICTTYIKLPMDNSTNLWRISSLVMDPYKVVSSSDADNCYLQDYDRYEYRGNSPWDKAVFPNQDICGFSTGNITITASPRAHCSQPSFLKPDATPIRATYSIEATDSTFSIGSERMFIINQELPTLVTCVIDKGSLITVASQLLSLVGGLLGVQQSLRSLMWKVSEWREKRKHQNESNPLLSLNDE